jgi:hypothetical protein
VLDVNLHPMRYPVGIVNLSFEVWGSIHRFILLNTAYDSQGQSDKKPRFIIPCSDKLTTHRLFTFSGLSSSPHTSPLHLILLLFISHPSAPSHIPIHPLLSDLQVFPLRSDCIHPIHYQPRYQLGPTTENATCPATANALSIEITYSL